MPFVALDRSLFGEAVLFVLESTSLETAVGEVLVDAAFNEEAEVSR